MILVLSVMIDVWIPRFQFDVRIFKFPNRIMKPEKILKFNSKTPKSECARGLVADLGRPL